MNLNFDLDFPDIGEVGNILASGYNDTTKGEIRAWKSNTELLFYTVLVTKIRDMVELLSQKTTIEAPSERLVALTLLNKLVGFGCTVCGRGFEGDDLVILRAKVKEVLLYNSSKWWDVYFDHATEFDGNILPNRDSDSSQVSLVHCAMCNDIRGLRGVL